MICLLSWLSVVSCREAVVHQSVWSGFCIIHYPLSLFLLSYGRSMCRIWHRDSLSPVRSQGIRRLVGYRKGGSSFRRLHHSSGSVGRYEGRVVDSCYQGNGGGLAIHLNSLPNGKKMNNGDELGTKSNKQNSMAKL